MKIKVILLSLMLILNAVGIVRHDKAFQFLTDGRQKQVLYYKFSHVLFHIEISDSYPIYKKDCGAFQSLEIFFFPEDFSFYCTIHWRYIKFIET